MRWILWDLNKVGSRLRKRSNEAKRVRERISRERKAQAVASDIGRREGNPQTGRKSGSKERFGRAHRFDWIRAAHESDP